MKIKAAILFIVLANIVILAHAVLPHHHHENRICFDISKHGDYDGDHGHHHSPADQSQNHTDGLCFLTHAIGIPSTALRIEPIYFEEQNDVSPHHGSTFAEHIPAVILTLYQKSASKVSKKKKLTFTINNTFTQLFRGPPRG